MLPVFLERKPEVRLIVFDSISVHFRQGFEDMSHRTRILNEMGQNLMALAESRSIAVRTHDLKRSHASLLFSRLSS